MQKYFLDVSQMSLVSEIPLFEIILQILSLEDEKIEYTKNNFQALLNDTSACTKQFLFKYKNLNSILFKWTHKRPIAAKNHGDKGNSFW